MDAHFKPEHYHRPTDLKTASSLLARRGARVIAGGTDLLVTRPADTETLIDVKELGLSFIREEAGLRIGSTTTFSDLLRSPLLERYPYRVLYDAASSNIMPDLLLNMFWCCLTLCRNLSRIIHQPTISFVLLGY